VIQAAITRDYFLLNGKASVRVWKGLEAFAQVTNITAIKYSDLLGAIMPGRWFLIGIKFNLER